MEPRASSTTDQVYRQGNENKQPNLYTDTEALMYGSYHSLIDGNEGPMVTHRRQLLY